MAMNGMTWPDRLAETRPAWPRRQRAAGDNAQRQRWLREPEPFEDNALTEPFPGAGVLADMDAASSDPVILHVLARYTVIRILLLCAAGRLSGPKLRNERRVAAGHLALLPSHDWERHALERLAAACTEQLTPDSLSAARTCAESATARGHASGAFALYRAVYDIGVQHEWWSEAAAAASGIRRLARSEEAVVSQRIWRWRERVLEARHARQQLDTAQFGTHPAS